MIQIKDRGDCIEVDNGKIVVVYDCWEEMTKGIEDFKLYDDERVYLREGNKLQRIKFSA